MVKLLKLFAYLLIYRDLNVSDTQKVIMVMLLNKSGFFWSYMLEKVQQQHKNCKYIAYDSEGT